MMAFVAQINKVKIHTFLLTSVQQVYTLMYRDTVTDWVGNHLLDIFKKLRREWLLLCLEPKRK